MFLSAVENQASEFLTYRIESVKTMYDKGDQNKVGGATRVNGMHVKI